MLPPDLVDKFWSRIFKTSTCWLWEGGRTTNGYGIFYFGKRSHYAHRLSWELHFGPIPKGLYVLHDCPDEDHPCCVNPTHLWLGSAEDNAKDAVKKGQFKPQAKTLKRLWATTWREKRGEKDLRHKLTNEQVIEMRRLHDEGIYGYKRLSDIFGVSFGVTQRICNRRSWRHLP